MTTCIHCGKPGTVTVCDRCTPRHASADPDTAKAERDRLYALQVQLDARRARMAG